MKLKGKYANDFGYQRFVGNEVTVTGKEKVGVGHTLVEVQMKVTDVPFPVTLLVHPEDVSNG